MSTILPVVCGWGDTYSVLVLHGIRSQYPPLIPEAGGGGQYSPMPSLMSKSLKSKYRSPLECSLDRRRCNLLIEISVQQTLDFWLQQGTFLSVDELRSYALLLQCCLCFYVHLKLDLGLQDAWFTTYFDGRCCRSMYGNMS